MSNDINAIIDNRPIEAIIDNKSIQATIDNRPIQATIDQQSIQATIDNREIKATIEGAIVNLSGGFTDTVVVNVRNTTNETLLKGTAVYINGATGQISTVAKAIATSDATSAQTLGLINADLPKNTNGQATIIGLIDDINTSAYTDGQQLYLSPTIAGGLTATKPYAPDHLVYIGIVEYAHPVHGKIFVKVQNGYELDELHDLSARNPSNNDFIKYNSTSGLWDKTQLKTIENQSILGSGNIDLNKVNKSGDTMTGALTITGAGLTVDSADNTLVVDATNNRVGIGTATPAQALDVVGQVASSSFFRTNSGLTNNSSGNNSTIRPQTTGTLIDRNVADGNPVLRVQNLNASSTGDVLRLQDSSTNNLVTVDKDGQMTLNSRSSSRALNVVPQVNTGASTTTGGAIRVDNTSNTGSGMLLYSNAGSGRAGRLMDMNIANAAFDKAGFHMDYAGVANAFEIDNTGTGTANIALNVVSTNSSDSAVGIAGAEATRGTVKIVHNKPTGTDAGSSALSLRTNGTGTSAHMIFGDAEDGGTTGDIMLMRQNGVNTWRVDKDGVLQNGTVPTARVQNLSGTNTGDEISFETVSKNLKSWDASFNYTSGVLTSIVYTNGANTITKTLNYTGDILNSIVLSGNTPTGIELTKTLNYTSNNINSITYS